MEEQLHMLRVEAGSRHSRVCVPCGRGAQPAAGGEGGGQGWVYAQAVGQVWGPTRVATDQLCVASDEPLVS